MRTLTGLLRFTFDLLETFSLEKDVVKLCEKHMASTLNIKHFIAICNCLSDVSM